MARATINKELHCKAKDEIGLLGRMVLALAQKKVFIQHLSAYQVGEEAYLQMIVKNDEIAKAKEAIFYFVPTVIERDILVVEFENKVGTLASVAQALGSNNIGIHYVYGTSSDGFKIIGVFSTTDNVKAAQLINSQI